MSIWDDVASDFAEVVDGLETVTFRRRTAGDEFTDTENVRGLRRQLERDPGSGERALPADTIVWHLYAADLTAGVKPKKGDRIKDEDDNEYVIGSVTGQGFLSRWRCETTKAK